MVQRVLDKKPGYAMLLSVLVLGAILMATTFSLMILGLDFSLASSAVEDSYSAKAGAAACAEEALQKIKESSSYAGSGSLIFLRGSCIYQVTNLGGSNRSIVTSSTVGRSTKRVDVLIDKITPKINVSSWQEN